MSNDRRQSGLWHRNPESGFYEQVPIPQAQIQPCPYQYYQPPAQNAYDTSRRSYSDRAANEPLAPTSTDIDRSTSKRNQDAKLAAARDVAQKITDPVRDMLNTHPETTSEQLAQTQHVNSTKLPGSSQQPPLRLDPDYAPDNVRAQAWSPDPMSPRTRTVQPQQKARQTSNASNRSETLRRGSVPERSPLQNLESWSQEEKRARVELAEHKARQRSIASGRGEGELLRQGTLRNEKARVVSDGAQRRPSQRDGKDERPRQVSEPLSPAQRFHDASQALREDSAQDQYSPRQTQPRPVSDQLEQSERAVGAAKDGRVDGVSRNGSSASAARGPTDLSRNESAKYRHRARDAGFAGAAAAASGGPMSPYDGAAERGKAAYERRKASMQSSAADSPVSPISRDSDRNGLGVGRNDSKKVQKRSPLSDEYGTRNQLQSDRMGGVAGSRRDRDTANVYQQPDPVPRQQVQNAPSNPVKYAVPPQTAAGQQAREKVSFTDDVAPAQTANKDKHHHFSDMFHRHGQENRRYQPTSKPLEDWRKAKAARLTLEDLDMEQAAAAASRNNNQQDGAWWEKPRRASSTGSRQAPPNLPQFDGPYEEKAMAFQPPLFLKCGPLLRYTGIRKETVQPTQDRRTSAMQERQVWRGSVMIVTEDDSSDLSASPVLRLFAQPMDLHEVAPPRTYQEGQELPPEVEDPVAGQVKLSRTGRALYVRPVHDIDGDVDLSRQENNNGLFSATRTPVLGPQSSIGPDGRHSQHITFQDKSRIKKRDGERMGRYRDVKAVRLHTEQGFTFWRFNLEIELASRQHRVAYRINKGPAIGFWVPARGETMNIMFHSCNGFSLSVDPKTFSGPDPLWRDVLNRHQYHPFHVMIGGGDQVYNDAAMRDTELFREWLQTKNPDHKHGADFSPEMQEELEQFYLDRYAMWFSQGLFSMANSQIPMVNIWDDHDIIDGYGSYPHHFMSTNVFTGLGAVAFKYYMLFQHQSLAAETERDEPSWLLGKSPGPYINELSRNIFMSLGEKVKFLGLDCRTERMRDEIFSQSTYDTIFDRCRREIIEGETKHLIVLLGVPIAYPRLNFLENILTSRMMDPIKAIGRTGMLGGFVNKFDGGVEILDDLDDHWTAKHHKAERNWFIQELQELAAEKSVRITILGGDVHLGAIGQFYTSKKLGVSKDKDHRYMPNVISSAIVNTPPPTMMADVLNRRNKVHHLDAETDEDMIPMFSHDVDGTRRNNSHLLPRRNFCVIREYVPGSTPPGTPVQEKLQPSTPASATFGADRDDENAARDKRFPPGSMKRTMSLTRGPVNLVRRLSGSSKSRNPPVSLAPEHVRPYNAQEQGPPPMKRANSLNEQGSNSYFPTGEMGERPVNTFHRRPTNLSIKEARKAAAKVNAENGLDGREPGHIDLEGGLDISLCMEVNQHDPVGKTVPYRLLVPALWYEGTGDVNTARFKSHRASLMDRLLRNRKREAPAEDRSWTESEGSRSRSPSFEGRPSVDRFDSTTERNTAANAMGLTSTGRGAVSQQSGPYGSRVNGTPTGMKNATPRQIPSNGYNGNGPSHTSSAYSKGYNLSSPPIGIHQQQQQHQYPGGGQAQHQYHSQTQQPQPRTATQPPSANNNPYPQSGYRRVSAPAPSNTKAPPPARQGYDGADYDSEGSLTPSEDFTDYDEDEAEPRGNKPPAPVRRGSKAERFFGIGDGGGRHSMDGGRRSMDQGRPVFGGGLLKRSNTAGGERSKWKIWK
ncbi:hypothetical protein M409DRAFT_69453 [Zasmidium cellare ATCC 36951]|uniref:PhoD-like phosphatase domain-containing protein n=1 Tax=Zasmidium cellare ATCC 36951 TaxID=1080233 RepID=A0A6A6C487_ZASCE|nr:uncharacterized protein M409DRAFT_69453 [Zasmidium cellare ATCC 36951]KAF2161934.1 hypothetical protein M409DRAFT_69453 [Zasmidium cellare ATCC 36951]